MEGKLNISKAKMTWVDIILDHVEGLGGLIGLCPMSSRLLQADDDDANMCV